MDTLHLMEFLKDMQKEDIYIRYVHQLVDLQADAQNFTEAGLALRLHAELYEWDPIMVVEALVDPPFPAQTSFERKEQLYFQMIKYYEDGLSWDNALGTYMELATQYEHNIFDFSKLARTQRAMATIYESISKGERQNPRYFRVVYKGLGFPVGLRDKQFIFEGSPSDRLATFTDRMQQQHPSAQILQAGGEEDVEGQYLQIYPVSPQKDLLHPIYQRAKVAQPIRDYYLLSRPTHFTTTSRRQGPEASIKDQTVEKTVYTTAEAFPTILRRSEITSVGNVTLTPLQTAIERTARKTTELLALEKRVADGEDSAFTSLTQELMMAVDPASETSIANYRDLLPKTRDSIEIDEEEEEQEEERPANLLENALKVAMMDYALVMKRCLALYSRPAHQATKADLTQRFEATFAYELTALMPGSQGPLMRSPTTSWLAASSPSLVTNPIAPPINHINGTQTSVVPEIKPGRHEKNRLSLTFLKRGSVGEPREGRKQTKPAVEEDVENQSNRASSHSGSKDTGKHRLSFLHQTSTNESAPAPSQPQNQSLVQTQTQSRSSQSIDRRPETSKSEQSSSHSFGNRVGSVRKRLSLLHIGRKASKNSVKGRLDETLAEE